MKAIYTTASGRLRIEIEGETVKAIFPTLAAVQEVFDAEHECGMCQSGDISYQARKVDDFDFYELRCNQCRARFSFGQAKKGGMLFPKRRDDDGRALPHGGWSRYEKPGSEPGEPPPQNGKPTAMGDATPEGLQPTFDRLGVLFNVPAPTRLGPALDLICDKMNEIAGSSGTAEFQRIYRKFESTRPPVLTAAIVKPMLKSLIDALDKLSLGVGA